MARGRFPFWSVWDGLIHPGKMSDRAERRGEIFEGEVCEGFTERQETSMKLVFTDVFDLDGEKCELAEIAQTRKVFSRVLCGFSHSTHDSDIPATVMPQRANVSEEENITSGKDDAVHPSFVVVHVDEDRSEEVPLAGPHPPSGHQSACD